MPALRRLRGKDFSEFRAILSYILHYPTPFLGVQVPWLLPGSTLLPCDLGEGLYAEPASTDSHFMLLQLSSPPLPSPSRQFSLCLPHYVARSSLLVASWERRQEGSKRFEIPHVSKYLYSTLYLKIVSQLWSFRSELAFRRKEKALRLSDSEWLAGSLEYPESWSLPCDLVFLDGCRMLHRSQGLKCPNGE